VAGD